MARATGLLVVASGLTYVVANTAPLVLTARLPAAPEVAASYVSLFVLARIPVFLFGPVQAFLLPTLTAGAERADLAHLRSRLRVALLAVAAVGVPGAVLTAALGPWAARTFFGAPLDLPHTAAGLLGAGTVAMLAAQVLQPALVALRVHRMATIAWVVGDAGVRRRARRARRPGDGGRGRTGRGADGGVPGHGRRRSPPACAGSPTGGLSRTGASVR